MAILLAALYDSFGRNATVWQDWFKVAKSGNPAERGAIEKLEPQSSDFVEG